jgi:hypothetical protein
VAFTLRKETIFDDAATKNDVHNAGNSRKYVCLTCHLQIWRFWKSSISNNLNTSYCLHI